MALLAHSLAATGWPPANQISVRRAPHRAQREPAAPPRAERPLAVLAASPGTRTVLRQKAPPGRGKRQQPSPHRWPGRSWLRCAEHPFDVVQVRFHALPQHPA